MFLRTVYLEKAFDTSLKKKIWHSLTKKLVSKTLLGTSYIEHTWTHTDLLKRWEHSMGRTFITVMDKILKTWGFMTKEFKTVVGRLEPVMSYDN